MFRKAEIEINILAKEDIIVTSIPMPDPGWDLLWGEENEEHQE